MSEIYVWVYTPSAVRDGYQIGAFRASPEWRFTNDVPFYSEDAAAASIWGAVGAVERTPTFRSAEASEAPLSAGLCEALNRMAQGVSVSQEQVREKDNE